MAKHEELPIPVFSSLEPVYGEGSQLEEANLRYENIKSKFLEVFGHPPHVFARSPGRVNLIGEHVDHQGYSVLPMAIRQDTIVAIRKHEEGEAEKVLRIANVNDEKYAMCTYPADPGQEINLKDHKWGQQSSSFFLVKKKNSLRKQMASIKAEKPAGTQAPGQVKKEPAKSSGSTPKAPSSKAAPKKTEQKPREPKKKAAGAK